MQLHVLKLQSNYFDDVLELRKKAEVRLNDRGYRVGDLLKLREYDPEFDEYSGSYIVVKVTHILEFPCGLKDGYVVMSFEFLYNGYED